MTHPYTPIAGLVALTFFPDAVRYNSQIHANQLSAAWFESLAHGLMVLARQLPTMHADIHAQLEGNARHVALRLKLGDTWIGSGLFEEDAIVPLSLCEPVRHYVRAVTALATHCDAAIWETDECNFGQSEAAWLARVSRADVLLLIQFMEICDLDHEVDHGSDMSRVVEAHGWTPETLALWVARSTTCCGQWGHDEDWSALTQPPLAEWLTEDATRVVLAKTLLAGAILHARFPIDADFLSAVAPHWGAEGQAWIDEALILAQSMEPLPDGAHWTAACHAGV